MSTPLVSIVLTCYNFERYIHSSVESILNQTTTDLELIIIDDASQDNSPRIIERFSKDKRVKIILQSTNQGAAESINRGFELSKGKYFCRFDGDDIWHLNFLTEMINALECHGEAGMAYCNCSYLNCDGKVTNKNVVTRRKKKALLVNEFEDLLEDYFITAPTIIFKKDILNNIFPIPKEFHFIDWYLSLSVCMNFPTYYLDKDLAFYRIHEEGMHVKMIANKKGEETTFKVIEHFSKLKALSSKKIRSLKSIYYYRFVYNYFGEGLYKDVRRCFWKIFANNPNSIFNMRLARMFVSSYLGKFYLPIKKQITKKA